MTANGQLYSHDTLNLQAENGYLTWIYVCEMELEGAWNARSTFDYAGNDTRGHELRYTLIRYLTSRGLRKDSAGVAMLSEEDISWIEKGVANIMFTEGFTFYRMFYELVWQVDYYMHGGNPSGHSVTQRIEYARAGWMIFREHPVFGVGTGDVPDAFARQYEKMGSILSEEWRLRAHNQYLTFLIAFGTVGFILVMISLICPAIMEGGFSGFRFVIFMSIAFLSMISEDTLETSAGAMFFSFFYALLIFGTKKDSYGT